MAPPEPQPSAHLTMADPTKIQNKFYSPAMREFTAWRLWGDRPPHTRHNLEYIPIANRFVKQLDYPAEMQAMMDRNWNAAVVPTTARPVGGPIIGRGRPAPVAPEGPSPLRRAFGAMKNNWNHIRLFEQVGAYAFRGDTRAPETLMASGGFLPPSMRTDDYYKQAMASVFVTNLERYKGVKYAPLYRQKLEAEVADYIKDPSNPLRKDMLSHYHLWRTILSGEAMHLKGMTNDSFMKAYISTTREYQVAFEGSSGTLGGAGVQQTVGGYIYALRIKSGFLLKTGVGGITKREGEISHLGPLKWKNVYGFAANKPGAEKVVYIRTGFDMEDFSAFKQVLGSLSSTWPKPSW